MKTETTWSEFPNVRKATAEQIQGWDDWNKSKGAELCQSRSGIHGGNRKINNLSKVVLLSLPAE